MLPNDHPVSTEASRSNPKQCAGTRKDGAPCTARVMGPGDYCFAIIHLPERRSWSHDLQSAFPASLFPSPARRGVAAGNPRAAWVAAGVRSQPGTEHTTRPPAHLVRR